jgi:glycosyltransferase involved in cell wall biosynthesis
MPYDLVLFASSTDLPLAWRKTLGSLAPEVRRRIKYVGGCSDEELSAWYRGASLFVYPTLAEGFGLPALEAMACGCPVLASPLTSVPEVVAGAGAYLRDPTEPRMIAEDIEKTLGDVGLLADLARRGLERASRFTWRRCAELTLQVYEALPY